MADTPLDVIIRRYVAPAAKQEGFSRKGRYFRLVGSYSHTLLYFDRQTTTGSTFSFEVGYALLPLAYYEFCLRLHEGGGGPSEPGRESIFLNAYLMPPDEWSYRPNETPPYVFKRRWTFDDSDPDVAEACGVALAQSVSEEAFPRMRWLLDMDHALAELTAPTFARQRAMGSDADRELMLMVDVADPARIEELLADPGRRPVPGLDAWIRERVAGR